MHLTAALALVFLFQAAPPAQQPSEGTAATAKEQSSDRILRLLGTSLQKADGSKVATKDVIKGRKNVVLYFTAGWCPPCRTFTPKLVKFFNKHKDNKDFTVVMVSSDRDAKAQASYMKKYDMTFYAVPYKQTRLKKIKQVLGGSGIPNLVILDADGEVVKGSYETDGKYTPKNRKSYIGPDKVLTKLEELVKANASTKA